MDKAYFWSRFRIIFLDLLLPATGIVLVLFAVNYSPATVVVPVVADCEKTSMMDVLQSRGKVTVKYETPTRSWQKAETAWQVEFTIARKDAVLILKHDGPSMCEALSAVYDQAQQFPVEGRK